jgi:site-specific DNA-cytosine methylase
VREAFDDGRIDWCPAGEGLYINTLEGHMKANIGDMLIEGVKGELYGCRADIFAATYEPVETTLAAQQPAAVAVALRGREGGVTAELGDEVQNCLRASSGGGDKPHVLTAMQVRRLTPRECERLMGFPDDYTLIPWRKKPADQCPDGPRYKALGNSWAVPVVRWIGERINAAVEQIKH